MQIIYTYNEMRIKNIGDTNTIKNAYSDFQQIILKPVMRLLFFMEFECQRIAGFLEVGIIYSMYNVICESSKIMCLKLHCGNK